jgi:Protein of unknown function (DUF1761)
MSLENLNLLGAIAGAVGAMAVGSLWYSPWLFANRWQELIGRSPDEMGSPVVALGIATLMFILMGIGMSWVIPDEASIGVGLMWGFLTYWAFVLPAVVINGVFERASWMLMAIYLGYMLIATLLMATLITFLGG